MKLFHSLFTPPSADLIAARLAADAQRAALEHEAAAEHHAALATMYLGRFLRLATHGPKPATPKEKSK
jgi:hypothetical protein